MRRAGASVVAGLLALTAVAACSGPESTTVHDEVEWVDGVQPSGPDEDDPRVEAVRRYDVLLKASTNELDLTDPRLAEVTTAEWIDARVDRARRDIESGMFALWQGPNDMVVFDIDGSADEAVVTMCTRLPTWWRWDDDTSEVLERSRDTGSFKYDTYELVREDGRWLVDSSQWGYGPDPSSDECDPGPDVPVGRFTTQPDLDILGTLTPDDVVAPSS